MIYLRERIMRHMLDWNSQSKGRVSHAECTRVCLYGTHVNIVNNSEFRYFCACVKYFIFLSFLQGSLLSYILTCPNWRTLGEKHTLSSVCSSGHFVIDFHVGKIVSVKNLNKIGKKNQEKSSFINEFCVKYSSFVWQSVPVVSCIVKNTMKRKELNSSNANQLVDRILVI